MIRLLPIFIWFVFGLGIAPLIFISPIIVHQENITSKNKPTVRPEPNNSSASKSGCALQQRLVSNKE